MQLLADFPRPDLQHLQRIQSNNTVSKRLSEISSRRNCCNWLYPWAGSKCRPGHSLASTESCIVPSTTKLGLLQHKQSRCKCLDYMRIPVCSEMRSLRRMSPSAMSKTYKNLHPSLRTSPSAQSCPPLLNAYAFVDVKNTLAQSYLFAIIVNRSAR